MLVLVSSWFETLSVRSSVVLLGEQASRPSSGSPQLETAKSRKQTMAALAATACRLGSGRVARVALTRVARPTTATHVAHRNMAGGPEFARMHINKNYWVEVKLHYVCSVLCVMSMSLANTLLLVLLAWSAFVCTHTLPPTQPHSNTMICVRTSSKRGQ